jgi:hypothetical protein
VIAPSAIRDQGRLILDTVIRGFEAAGVDLPERRIIAPGRIVEADAAQVSVQLVSLVAGHPGQPVAQYQRPPAGFRTATWQITISRYVATQGAESAAYAPDPLDIEADAEAAWTDVAVLLDLLEKAKLSRTLTGLGVPITLGPTVLDGPMGGLAAVQVTVSMALEGAPSR